jgi:predicted membrane channel-forming protein YqfA (hemolysin III family)
MLSVGTILPDAILLLGSDMTPNVHNHFGFAFALLSIVLCAYACKQIMKQEPSVALQALVASWWVLPFLLPNYFYMTTVEFSAMLMTCLFQGLGVAVFTRRSPDPLPHFFGFHEVFHSLVVMAGMCVLICNISIVSRYGVAYEERRVLL